MNATTKTLTGRKIRIQGTPDTLGYNAIITDAETGEMIEGIGSIQIIMKPHEPVTAILICSRPGDLRDFGTRRDLARSLIEVREPILDLYAQEELP